MALPDGLRPDMSVTDLAYMILKRKGQPLHFKELIAEIMQVKAFSAENAARLLAQIHTEINLDSRFVHKGGGEWGLRDWAPKAPPRVVKLKSATAPVRKRRGFDLDDEGDTGFYDEEGDDDDDDDGDEHELGDGFSEVDLSGESDDEGYDEEEYD